MTTVGMLHHRLDPRKVFKAYTFAAVAKAEGIDFFYFTPGRVNLEDQIIKAQVLENGDWVEKILPFPDVIYNASSPMTDKAYDIYERLEEFIPFTSHSIGDKLTVYRLLKKNKEFAHYLLPTEEVEDAEIVLDLLKRHSKVVLKPTSGHKGLGLLFLEKDENKFIVREETTSINTLTYRRRAFRKYLDALIKNNHYLVQPFIQCQTKSGLAFDFRLHAQKNGGGKWVTTNVFPRIAASPAKKITNLATHGYTTVFDYFLKEEFGDHDYNMKQYLEYFTKSFAEHMDKAYDESLDELGIDVGIDSHQKIWIYEVNWRPGPPPLFFLQLDVPINTLRYAVYLANQNKKRCK